MKERAFEDIEIRRLLRLSGFQLEEISVIGRLKGRPIRKLYVSVKARESSRSGR